jgi:hypothetical protein
MMLPAIAVLALGAFAVALVGGAFALAPILALTHLVLSVGILPLILGAIIYFVPVLTRSRAPGGVVRFAPGLALVAGVAPVLAFVSVRPAAVLFDVGAVAAIVAATATAGWMAARAVRAIGAPHPCLYWYLAALVCLILALCAVLAMRLWPEQYLALRRLHLHLNTLGFISITAVGTLQVLVPTVVNRRDPAAARRLRTDIVWALGGALLVALGSAWLPALGLVGAALWAVVLVRLAGAWWSNFRREIFAPSGGAPSLGAALLGLLVLLLAGALHGERLLLSAHAVPALFAAFLLPLVTGALSHLLPLWRRPTAPGAWHDRRRATLQRWSGLRAVLFLGGGVLLLLGVRTGYALAGAALALFALSLVRSSRLSDETARG